MNRPRVHFLEFANFICKFGDEIDMLDLAEEVVIPALRSGETRQHGGNKYVITKPKILDLGDGNVGLAFQFMKQSIVRRDQVLDRANELVSDRAHLERAGAAHVLLILNNHRLVFLPVTTSAPAISELEATCRLLINRQRAAYIRGLVEETERGERASAKLALKKSIPRATVNIVPLPSEKSIRESLARFDTLNKVSISLIDTNSELESKAFFSGLRALKKELGATTTKLEHTSKEGLNKEVAANEIDAAAKHGNTRFSLTGKGMHKEPISQKNEDVRIREEADFDVSDDVVANTKNMYAQFSGLAARGVIKLPTFKNDAKQKAQKILKAVKD